MEFEGQISALSEQGMGVVKAPDGKTYFVRGAWPLDIGVFRVFPPQKYGRRVERYGFGDIVRLITPSPERTVPRCFHLGLSDEKCGGCPWMIADYQHQLHYKTHRIAHALQRVGMDGSCIKPIWVSDNIYNYRARAQFKTDGKVIGYSGKQGKTIAPVDRCLILNDKMTVIYDNLKKMLPVPQWRPTGDRVFSYIDVDQGCDLTTEVIINHRRAFSQANPQQNMKMREWLRQKLQGLPREAVVVELFAGSGNFTQMAAMLGFHKIIAIDVHSTAVEALVQQNLAGVSVTKLDLFAKDVVPQLVKMLAPLTPQIIITNPPRQGMAALTALPTALATIKDLCYISCNPVTFATDIRKMSTTQFTLQEVQPIDMLPHTPHIEMLGHMRFKNGT